MATGGRPAMLSVPQAAERLGISTWAYYRALRREEVPGFHIGRRILVPEAALARLIDTGEWRAAS